MTDTPEGQLTTTESAVEAPKGTSEASGTLLTSTPTTEPSKEATKWFESLPDALKNDKSIQKFDSYEKLADGYVNANKLLGKRVSELAPDELKKFITAEEMHAISLSQGLPTSVDEYKIPKYEEFVPDEVGKLYKNTAMQYNIKPEALEKLIDVNMQVMETQRAQQHELWRTDAINTYGAGLKDTLGLVRNAIMEFGGKELYDEVNKSGLADNPLFIKTFANIGRAMTEDKIPSRTTTATNDQLMSVQSEIKNLLDDPKFKSDWRQQKPHAMAKLDSLYRRQQELEGR